MLPAGNKSMKSLLDIILENIKFACSRLNQSIYNDDTVMASHPVELLPVDWFNHSSHVTSF